MDLEERSEILEAIVRAAGDISRNYFNTDMQITRKGDGSPVTKADLEISQYIESSLQSEFPTVGVLSEEGPQEVDHRGTCWIIDPIDGTSNFITKNPDFTISVALVSDGNPEF